MDMDDALEEWLKQVSKAAKLSINDQEKITKAGADVYAKKLAETTKENTQILRVLVASMGI